MIHVYVRYGTYATILLIFQILVVIIMSSSRMRRPFECLHLEETTPVEGKEPTSFDVNVTYAPAKDVAFL